jgi:hypothetical protein
MSQCITLSDKNINTERQKLRRKGNGTSIAAGYLGVKDISTIQQKHAPYYMQLARINLVCIFIPRLHLGRWDRVTGAVTKLRSG